MPSITDFVNHDVQWHLTNLKRFAGDNYIADETVVYVAVDHDGSVAVFLNKPEPEPMIEGWIRGSDEQGHTITGDPYAFITTLPNKVPNWHLCMVALPYGELMKSINQTKTLAVNPALLKEEESAKPSIQSEINKTLIEDLRNLERSLDRREQYVPMDTPLNKVNWSTWTDALDSKWTVGDIEDIIKALEL